MNLTITQRTLATFVLLVAAATAPAFSASTAGTWTIGPSDNANRVRFEIRIHAPNYNDSSTTDVDLAALGLSNEQLQSSGQHVSFTLARDAGSFDCDGWIARGSGGGNFTFNPNAEFVTKMRALGYDDITAEQQVTAAIVDLTSAYAQGIAAAGYPHLPFQKLVAFRALQIDDAYVRSMRAAFGSADIGAETMISLKALRVTPDYVSQLRNAGLVVSSPRSVISLAALRVDLAYVNGLASAGYSHLTSEQIVQLRAMHIDNAYIEKVRAHGFAHPSIEELVRLKALNVI